MTSNDAWECANHFHINEGDDVCARCGIDLNPASPTPEQKQAWVQAVNEDRTELGLWEWVEGQD